MSVAEALGYLAALLVFVTFYMKTMVPLRLAAIASNVAFIGYGVIEDLYPVLLLHLTLLPLNIQRLLQVRQMMRQLEHLRTQSADFTTLVPHMLRLRMAQGEVIFKKGDRAEALYYVARGRIGLRELDATVDAGSIVGELGMFAPARTRTATAVCLTDCEIYSLSQARLQELCYQNPAFAFAFLHLVTDQLQRELHEAPNGYDGRFVNHSGPRGDAATHREQPEGRSFPRLHHG